MVVIYTSYLAPYPNGSKVIYEQPLIILQKYTSQTQFAKQKIAMTAPSLFTWSCFIISLLDTISNIVLNLLEKFIILKFILQYEKKQRTRR